MYKHTFLHATLNIRGSDVVGARCPKSALLDKSISISSSESYSPNCPAVFINSASENSAKAGPLSLNCVCRSYPGSVKFIF